MLCFLCLFVLMYDIEIKFDMIYDIDMIHLFHRSIIGKSLLAQHCYNNTVYMIF